MHRRLPGRCGESELSPSTLVLLVLLTLGAGLLTSACGGAEESEIAETGPSASPTTPPAAISAAPAAPVGGGGAAAAAQPLPVAASAGLEDCAAWMGGSGGEGNTSAFVICRAENLRQVVDLYVAALNAYDVDRLLPLLEDSYRAEHETAIRAQVHELKAAGTQLTWTEDQLPGKTGPTSMAFLITVAGGPSGAKQWQIGFIEVGEKDSGDWAINFVVVKE